MPYDLDMETNSQEVVRAKLEAFIARKGYGVIDALCDAAGISRKTLWRFRNGKNISMDNVKEVDRAMDTWEGVDMPSRELLEEPWTTLIDEFSGWNKFLANPQHTSMAKRSFLRTKLRHIKEIVDLVLPDDKGSG
jgi:hypothetical protein